MPFRFSILEVSPPYLLGEVGTAVQYAEGAGMDAIGEWAIEGVRASMPGYGTPDALYLIGRDMQIDRGPNETDDHYIDRLQGAVDSHRVRGSGAELLKQLLAWFSPSTDTPLRLVSNAAVWHEIDTTTEVVTKTVVGTNWDWDSLSGTRWWRGWVIIDSSVGPWSNYYTWGDPGLWNGVWGDTTTTWGSDATPGEVAAIRRIVEKWKPANIIAGIIVTFDAGIFERTDVSPPNPDGTSDRASWRNGYNAIFWSDVT